MRSRLTLLTLFSFVLSIFGTIASQAHASNADQTRGQARVIITFHHQPGPAQEALIQSLGGEVHHTFHLIPGLSGIVPEEALFGLSHNPHVAGIYLDTQVHAIDAELDNTWGVKRIGAGTVHDGENTGTGVKVAIIDSGIDYTHPDISANYVGGYDFVNDDEDPLDDNGHGTHVAGTVAALKNDIGVVGVAPQASLYALKVLDANGSGYWSDIIAALEWAVDNGMQVTNNSYGAGQNPGSAIETAFANADAAGILAIAAAGNSGNCGRRMERLLLPFRQRTRVIRVHAFPARATPLNSPHPAFPFIPRNSAADMLNSTELPWLPRTLPAQPHSSSQRALPIRTATAASMTKSEKLSEPRRKIWEPPAATATTALAL